MSYVYNKRSVYYEHVVQLCSFPHCAVIVVASLFLFKIIMNFLVAVFVIVVVLGVNMPSDVNAQA